MGKLDDFYKNATDEQWDKIAAEREKIRLISDENERRKAEGDFKNRYGFYPDSVRSFQLMHYVELEKRQKMQKENSADAELQQENARLKAELETLKGANQGLPQWHKITGTPAKGTIYSTKEAIDLYNRAVDWVEAEYCCKRCYASAFVLEEAIKRMGIPQEN